MDNWTILCETLFTIEFHTDDRLLSLRVLGPVARRARLVSVRVFSSQLKDQVSDTLHYSKWATQIIVVDRNVAQPTKLLFRRHELCRHKSVFPPCRCRGCGHCNPARPITLNWQHCRAFWQRFSNIGQGCGLRPLTETRTCPSRSREEEGAG